MPSQTESTNIKQYNKIRKPLFRSGNLCLQFRLFDDAVLLEISLAAIGPSSFPHKQRYSHIIDLIVMHKNNKYQMPAELKVALVGAKGVGKVPSLCTLYVYL